MTAVKNINVILRDLIGIAGAALADYGVFRLSAAAALIVGGLMLVAAALAIAWKEQG